MRSWRVGAVLLAVAILLASAWASGWHRFTWGARSGTFGCVLAVLGVGLLWRHRQPSARSSGSDGAAPLPVVNHTGAALWLVVILVAVVWDVLGLLTPPRPAPPHSERHGARLPTPPCAAVCLLVGHRMGARVRTDAPARAVVAMPSASHLGAALGAACRTFSVVIGSSKPIALAFWLAVIAALSTLEALTHLTRGPVPSAGDLVARYLHRTVLRVVAIAVWLYAGWHLFSH